MMKRLPVPQMVLQMKYRLVIAALLSTWSVTSGALPLSPDRPQYLCVNNNQGWNANNPSSFTQESVDEILSALNGTRGSVDGSRRLCISFDFWVQYDTSDPATLAASADALLALSLANDIPVSMSIDATQWWDTRPELWNWWNASAPGYDQANVANVEWTAPSSLNATSISWRNWGSQFRMNTPAPNFASPAYRAAAAAAMLPVAQRVAAWFAALPSDKKYLLAFVRVEQELWVGTNFFVYPGANGPDGQPSWPPSKDPQGGVAESAQVGYAAVCTAATTSDGTGTCPPVTTAALDSVVQSLIQFSAGVIAGAGLPRSRLLAHTGFFDDPPPSATLTFNSPEACITTSAGPGWSLYTQNTLIPNTTSSMLDPVLDKYEGTPWGAPEWLAFFNGGSEQQWTAAFNATLSYRNNRLIVVQNWGSIYPSNGPALLALRDAVGTASPCLVGAATGLTSARLNSTHFALNWQAGGGGASSVILDASQSPLLVPSGRLSAPFASLPMAADATSLVLELPTGISDPFYWTVTTFGCLNAGPQTVVADEVNSNTT